MKTKLLLLIIILFACLPLAANEPPYRSYFGEEYTKWYTLYDYVDHASYSAVVEIGNEEVELGNGLKYKPAYYITALYEMQPVFYYYMREDRETGELYIHIEGEEILVSTMNLKEGDKFYFPDNIHTDYFNDLRKDENGYYTIVEGSVL